MTGFVDAAYANELHKQRSTTGLVFTFCGGAVVYKSKTQSLTAWRSTEEEFIDAHTAAEIAKYLCMILGLIENNLLRHERIFSPLNMIVI